MGADDVRRAGRESYEKHARDGTGNHLPGECPECERVEGLEKNAAALAQVSNNCTVLLDALKVMHEKHGCGTCLDCMLADHLIQSVEHYRKTGELLNVDRQTMTGTVFPDPRFEKVVSPDGYPVAQFYTRVMGTETADPNTLPHRQGFSGRDRGDGPGRR